MFKYYERKEKGELTPKKIIYIKPQYVLNTQKLLTQEQEEEQKQEQEQEQQQKQKQKQEQKEKENEHAKYKTRLTEILTECNKIIKYLKTLYFKTTENDTKNDTKNKKKFLSKAKSSAKYIWLRVQCDYNKPTSTEKKNNLDEDDVTYEREFKPPTPLYFLDMAKKTNFFNNPPMTFSENQTTTLTNELAQLFRQANNNILDPLLTIEMLHLTQDLVPHIYNKLMTLPNETTVIEYYNNMFNAKYYDESIKPKFNFKLTKKQKQTLKQLIIEKLPDVIKENLPGSIKPKEANTN